MTRSTHIRLVCVLSLAAALGMARPVRAQYPDSYVVPGGVLRVSFEPWYLNYRDRFDADGNVEPLGTDLTRDSAGVNFFPSLLPAELALRSLTDDSTYAMNAGRFSTVLDADIRRFPLNVHFGLSNRFTFFASLPIVTTRMQVDFTVDSTDANVGWNQIASTSGNATALQQTTALLGEIQAAGTALADSIAAGAFGCPTSPQCSQAQDVLARAQDLESHLSALTGVAVDGTVSVELPPFAPLASSPTGQALLGSIQSLSGELAGFGAPTIAGTLPLPEGRLSAEDVNGVLTTTGFGYDAQELAFVKYTQRLGDLEVGLRWGVIQQPAIRAVVTTTVRLPTGLRDTPSHFVDLGTGDKQTDVQIGLDAALEPGSVVGLALSGYYNLQLGDALPRRVASHRMPIQLVRFEQNVERDLGDVLFAGAYPTLRLSRAFRAFGFVEYLYKQADSYSDPAAADLAFETSMRRLHFGGGVHYRSTGRTDTSLPIEAGLRYQAAFSGSGGQTPKTAGVNLYLRLFFRLFGGAPAPEAPAEGTGN